MAVVGWVYTHIHAGQIRSEQEISKLNGVIADLQKRPSAPSTDDAERRTTSQVVQLARSEARNQALTVLSEHDRTNDAAGQEEHPMTLQESQRRVRSAFAAEAVDASWAPDAERALERMLRSRLPETSRLNAIACHSSMCEVQLRHIDARAHVEFLRTGFHGWAGSLFIAEETQGPDDFAVIVIAARDGTEPPIAPRW
jgi:hypothetical protein